MADDDNDKRGKRQGARPFGERRGGKFGGFKRGEREAEPAGKSRGPGGKKPFAKRHDDDGTTERPKRDFKPRKEDRRSGGFRDRPAKPFTKRADSAEAAGERPPRTFGVDRRDGDRKPFKKRAESAEGGKPFRKQGGFGPRPGGRERAAEAADAPREGRTFKRSTGQGRRSTPSALPGISTASDEIGQSSERIAKRLARAGIASRRDAEALIADGRVKVNGQVLTSPAFNVSASDRIEVDDIEIPPVERTRLFLFHKPAGVVTTNRDPEGRRTVFDVLPEELPRLITVGRLDINTEGLLLLTNDGGLARLLELPSTGWLRRYRVRVHGTVDETALAGLREGIAVDGVFYGSVEASLDREQGTNAWLTIGLREGKNREVKNILGALGLGVTRLIRVSYGPFQLGELAEGAVQELKGRTLRDQLGERLIEEAGANFDAPVAKPFSNKPVHGPDEARPERAERPKIVRDGIRGKIGEGGLIKQRRRDRSDERESALSRLSTKPDKGRPFAKDNKGKSFAKGGEKPGERAEPSRARTSNVWMAPGARPQGKKGGGAFSPLEREMAAKRPEGVVKGRVKRKEKSSSAEATPPGRSAATLPSRGRGGGAPRGKGSGRADRRR